MNGDVARRAAEVVSEVTAHADTPKSELWRLVLERVEAEGLEHEEELALKQQCYAQLFGIELR
jgi:hypothetical protein